ncbi:molybdopterin converting factor subunit 1 [Oceanobacillus profundus]|uniref:molybdopterin converting factor subunit 1 n=1 Tax=Oceanobacillus profundus TaxID=372463 RepID=UPI002040BA1D|nr:molybdopterin converting factor subunit 1 [Oceanobacillus profundus]MCM3397771.1 molybdopterin converting factor subunit 1 [Oceanobacillus profundus]
MIKILLFAHLQEKAGSDQLTIDKEQTTIRDLKNILKETYQLIELDQVMTAVNEEYVMDDEIVKAGDTVAFIPPVSGG